MSNETKSCATTPADQGVELKTPIDGLGNLISIKKIPIVQSSWRYNLINSDLFTTTNTGSGSATSSNSKLICSTTASSSSSSKVETKRKIKARPGQAIDVNLSCKLTTGKTGSSQMIGWGSTIDGLFFGYNGSSFGVLHRNNTTDTWVAQSSFNGDTLDGTGESKITIDPTKFNAYRIHCSDLGIGDAIFYIHSRTDNTWIEVHRIRFDGTTTQLAMKNPSLPLMAMVSNTTNDTNISIEVGEWSGFIMGEFNLRSSVQKSISNLKTGITTEVNVLTIRNNTTFNSETNLTEVHLKSISVAVDGAKISLVKVYHNATLGGTPSYTDVDTGKSCVSYDTAGTTVTGGHLEAIYSVDKTGSIVFDIETTTHLYLQPGDTATVTCTSSNATECQAAAIWHEDF